MNWVQLIIPLIALAVWIIASIIGTIQQQQQRAPRRNLPKTSSQEPEVAVNTEEADTLKPTEEMERKLEEAKRRRRAQAEKQHEVDRKRQVESDQARRRSTLSTEPPSRPPVLPQEPVRTPERRAEPAPVATPVRERPAPRPTQTTTPAAPSPVAVSSLALSQVLGPAAQVKRTAPSPVATEVSRLLKQPVSLAAAFMLREVFDPPLALRKRKG